MDEIVFLTPNTKEPFTTSDVIAECTGIESRKVNYPSPKGNGFSCCDIINTAY